MIYRALPEARNCPYAVSSTVLPAEIGDPPQRLERLFDIIEEGGGSRPEALIHAYMCAGWGYALEYYLHNTCERYLMLTIADVDPYDFRFHTYHPAIGSQGFGVSTVLFSLPEKREGLVVTGSPPRTSVFTDFVRAVRSHKDQMGPTRIFMPFLRADLLRIAESVLGEDLMAPNKASKYAHCFGSDPFIGIIEWLQEGAVENEACALAGGLAFNGYYSFSALTVSSDTMVSLCSINGDEKSLRRAVRDAADEKLISARLQVARATEVVEKPFAVRPDLQTEVRQ
ncbi:MAG: hypothetical protein R3C60_02400 [Parvularculaceae bacterium]